ncbi:MAG TPA: hypothetical protein VHK67_07940 [Rhabdochlamydiaceae bacterium]|jgi:hypothetical protein|nr:hypothetical protein [Rhabdochlamydiaceae bacterium]
MSAMSLPSFDYSGLSFIALEFDRHHGRLTRQEDQKGRAVVMHQLQRHLLNTKSLPIEVIDIIFQYHLNDTRSASDLLVFYRGSPAIHAKSPLLLYHVHYLNTAAENLLKQLKLKVPLGDAFPHLMVHVLTHYFNTLSLDNKIAFIRSSQVTVWENRSLTEKIQLLGRARITSLSNALRLISWKVQFAIIKILENKIFEILFLVFVSCLALPWIVVFFGTLFGFSETAFIQQLSSIWRPVLLYTAALLVGCMCLSLITAVLGKAAQFSWFSQSIKNKGAWVQAVSLCCVRIEFNSLIFLLSFVKGKDSKFTNSSLEDTMKACKKLSKLLSQSINEANLTFNQEAFVNAHRPELNQQWLQIAQ